jgi:hypothetical protein
VSGVAAVLLIVMATGLLRGCTSMPLPRPLTDVELSQINKTRYNASVGVEKDENPLYSDRLIRALRKTELFNKVEKLENLPNPDLIARVERHIYGTATVPFLTGLSLGFIPTIVREEWGEVFSLRSLKIADSKITIDLTYKGTTVLGWAAGFWNFSPNRTFVNPRETQRFYQALANVICSRDGEIRRMLGK